MKRVHFKRHSLFRCLWMKWHRCRIDKGGDKMKKILFGAALLAVVVFVPFPSTAAVDIRVSIPLPPMIVFPAPPSVIVIPETYVYFVPDVEEEIFFYEGWWWRPWQGRWYRSRHYGSGWVYYKRVPSFYPSSTPGGGTITGIAAGKDMNGTSSPSLTINFSKTGVAGKSRGIGKSNKHGVSRV